MWNIIDFKWFVFIKRFIVSDTQFKNRVPYFETKLQLKLTSFSLFYSTYMKYRISYCPLVFVYYCKQRNNKRNGWTTDTNDFLYISYDF